MSESSRSFGWWDAGRRACELLTSPHADVAACDRAVEQLARDSWLGSLVRRASGPLRNAWAASWARRSALALVAVLAPAPEVAFRAAGWTMAVAGATVLALDALKPMPVGPLSWLVPAAVAMAGLLLMATASPFARAAAGRRFRHKVS